MIMVIAAALVSLKKAECVLLKFNGNYWKLLKQQISFIVDPIWPHKFPLYIFTTLFCYRTAAMTVTKGITNV